MRIHTIHIMSFGGLKNREFNPGEGVNVYYGENETGKTSVAMFVKFMLYGLRTKNDASDGLSELKHFVNRETGQAAGWMTVETDDGESWRLERALIVTKEGTVKERVRMINTRTDETIAGRNPGEYFFGLPEQEYTDSCFVMQNARLRPDAVSGHAVHDVELGKTIDILRGSGTASEIDMLKQKRASILETQAVSANEPSPELDSLMSSLDGINARIKELESDQAEYDELYDALNTINTSRRFELAEKIRGELDDLNGQMDELKNLPYDEHFPETLMAAEQDIRAYEKESSSYNEWKVNYAVKAPSQESLPDPVQVIEETEHIASSFKTKAVFSAILFILGLVGLIAAFFMYSINMDTYFFPLIFTLAAVIAAVLLLASAIRTRNRLKDKLNEWDVESLEELEQAVDDRIVELEYERETAKEDARRNSLLNSAQLRYGAAIAQLDGILKAAGFASVPEDAYQKINHLKKGYHDYTVRYKELEEEIARQGERLGLLEEQLGGVDGYTAATEAEAVRETESGQTAASLDSDGVRELKKKKDFTDNALRAAIGRRNTLTEKIAELRRTGSRETEAAIAEIDSRIAELSGKRDGAAQKETGISPSLAARTVGLVKNIAGSGETEQIGQFLDGRLQLGYLSRGTADLTWLALRLALADERFEQEKAVAVMDESFAHIDGKRAGAILTGLPSGQYLIFTCRQEEAAAARNAGIPVTVLHRPA